MEKPETICGACGGSGIAQPRPTDRERQILIMLAEGKQVKEIARELGLSEKTVSAHTFNVMRKLDIHNRSQLTMYAVKEGLVKI